MIDINMIEKLVSESLVVIVKISNLKGCSVTIRICDPIVVLDMGMIIISNEHDENEVQIDINNFDFNQYNSSDNKLVFNSKLNFANSLSIQSIDIE